MLNNYRNHKAITFAISNSEIPQKKSQNETLQPLYPTK